MLGLSPKTLLSIVAFCVIFTVSSLTAFTQCEGVYFKPINSRPISEAPDFVGGISSFKDVTGDNKIDIVKLSSNPSTGQVGTKIYILPGNGDGTFGVLRTIPLPTNAYQIQVADFNTDGKNDLFVGFNFSSLFAVYLNDGNGNFTQLPAFPFPVEEIVQNTVDINND